MDFAGFRKSIESPAPAYLLITDQDYLKRKVYDHCLQQVEEGARAFDWGVFDLRKDPIEELLNTARTLPWMGERRWIYVRNADAEAKAIGRYLKRSSSRTVLILDSRKKPAGWPRLPTIQMPDRLDPVRWILQRARSQGYEMERQAALSLVEYVGEDLQRLDSELEKLFLWKFELREIDPEAVREMVFQTREHDIFALIGAVAERDSKKALLILNALFRAGMSPQQILSMLYWNFRRLLVAKELLERGHPFQAIVRKLKIWSYRGRENEIRGASHRRLTGVLLGLRQTDRLCKSTSLDEKIHLEQLIIDISGS
ncbi:MAG: DNA polymerase III subunit delta [Acidobacteriota bacterium]